MSPSQIYHKSKKKVLFLAGSLGGGGAEKLLIQCLNNLNRDKFELSICLFKNSGVFKDCLPPDIAVYDLKKQSAFDTVRLIKKLAGSIYPKVKPDIVLSFLEYPSILSCIARFFSRHKPKLVFVEQIYPVGFWEYGGERFRKLIERVAAIVFYRCSDKIVAISEAVKKGLIRNLFLPTDKISVIHNGIDISQIEEKAWEEIPEKEIFENGSICLIACGRLVPQKNYPLLLRAFALIQKKENIRLVILGEGREKNKLQKIITELGLNEDVYILGFKKNPYAYISRSDIYVLSSNFEGLAVVLLEAMACKKPVISTDSYGTRDVLQDGVNSIVVKRKDINALKEAMQKLIRDESLRYKLAEKGHEGIKKFDIEKVVSRYENTLELL
jgi:glycosyltransferase involved in cell wall biosynthesis